MSLPDIPLTLSNGDTYSLRDYENYVILVVNTATSCGLRSQFEGLEELYQEYKDEQFVVLGFPSNQFKQEHASDEEMASTCKTNFGVTFPIHQRTKVNGDETHPLFQYLKEAQGGVFSDALKWNFTKFLVDREGNVVERYAPTKEPNSFEDKVQSLVQQ